MNNRINIAIDGPAGAGKSTVARQVAEQLGYIYVDTGAMYRAITWKALQNGLRADQISDIVEIAESIHIELVPHADGQHVLVDGQDAAGPIRSAEVTRMVSPVSAIRRVREVLAELQQRMASAKGVVMDGRDIGTHVLPDAEVKIFLTASVHTRAERRYKELLAKQADVDLEQLERDMEERDRMDREREFAPLLQAHDAVLIDCTAMNIFEVVDAIVQICRKKIGEA